MNLTKPKKKINGSELWQVIQTLEKPTSAHYDGTDPNIMFSNSCKKDCGADNCHMEMLYVSFFSKNSIRKMNANDEKNKVDAFIEFDIPARKVDIITEDSL